MMSDHRTYQRLKCFDIFNFIPTQVEVIELWATMKKVQTTRYSVVTEFQLKLKKKTRS